MKKYFFILHLAFVATIVHAQISVPEDTIPSGTITVKKDRRLDVLAKKEAEFNDILASMPRAGKGYRLMLLSTNDRSMAMSLRAGLLERFPEQKIYMSFQPPYIKLKFGNFMEKADADKYKDEIIKSRLVTGNIYLVPETIEIKPDKDKDKDKQKDIQQ